MIGGEKLKQVEYKVKLYFRIMKEKVSTIIIYVLITLISFSITSMIILGYYTKKENYNFQVKIQDSLPPDFHIIVLWLETI